MANVVNMVAINLRDARGAYADRCHVSKCANEARYQLFPSIPEGELPDWEGLPICSKHLAEQARHNPEIMMSLIDMLVDVLEQNRFLTGSPAPTGGAERRVLSMRKK